MPQKYDSEKDLLAAMFRRGTRIAPGPTGTVALYHQVHSHETFTETALMLFDVVRCAQDQFPGKPRHLFLDINEHRNDAGGYDGDMYELQVHFITEVLAHWLTAVTMPLADFVNLKQDDDVPPELVIT